MSVEVALTLLFAYSAVTTAIVEVIKKLIQEKDTRPYNLIALITAMIVGLLGTFIYYLQNNIPYTLLNIVYAILLSIASGGCSMLGFDKIKQIISQLGSKDEK